MSSKVRNLSHREHRDLLAAGGVTLIDYWAEWCQPCHAMTPILEQVQEDYRGRVTVAKVDVHEHQEIADELGISSLPTLIFYRDGVPMNRLSGVKRGPRISRELYTLLDSSP